MDPNRPSYSLPECGRCHEREEKHAGKDGIEGRPQRKGEGPSLEKQPKLEREAFQVSFCYIGLELIF